MDHCNDLDELWNLFKLRKDQTSLALYLEEFLSAHEHILDNFFMHQDESSYSENNAALHPHKESYLLHFPKDFLQVAQNKLMHIQDSSSSLQLKDIKLVNCLVQVLSVVLRTKRSVAISTNLSTNFVGYLLVIASNVVLLLRNSSSALGSGNKKVSNAIEHFLHSSFYFFEILYDPTLIWRLLVGQAVKRSEEQEKSSTGENSVPFINAELIPFFYETLQVYNNILSKELQLHLLHMFGAVICGRDENAQLATSSTTLEILVKYLSLYIGASHDKSNENGGDASDGPHHHQIDEESTRLVLKLVIRMVHTLHKAGPVHQCQLEVKTVLKKYFKLLSQTDDCPAIQLQMIGAIPEILDTSDRVALQTTLFQMGCFEQLKKVLTNCCKNVDSKSTSEAYAVEFINVVASLVAGSVGARDAFSKCFGASAGFFLHQLQAACEPSSQIFVALVDMIVETKNGLLRPHPIKNVFVARVLLDWLPEIEQETQQVWLSSVLSHLFTSCTSNLIIAIQNHIVKSILVLLMRNPSLCEGTVFNLIEMLERLGSYSISPLQTKMLLEILRQDSDDHAHLNKYFNRLMSSLGAMAFKERTECKPAFFFDLQENHSGIIVPEIRKWGGPAVSIHAWVCIEYLPDVNATTLKRKQFYSFFTEQGTGVEAFFTVGCQLVVAVATKKQYLTVALNEAPLIDNKWHCIQIVHQPSRKVFGFYGGNVSIYVDGQLKLNTQLRAPSLGSAFTNCCIGSAGQRSNDNMRHQLANSVSYSRSSNNSSNNVDRVVTIESNSQDEVWGQATSLHGQLGSFVAFNEALKENQLRSLYQAGVDLWETNRSSDNLFCEVPRSKMVLYYEAKACHRFTCRNLSHDNSKLDGRVTGHKIDTRDIKDAINCIGGLPVLTPLLEVINSRFINGAENVFFKDQDSAHLMSLDDSTSEEHVMTREFPTEHSNGNVQLYNTSLFYNDYLKPKGKPRRILYPSNPLANYFSILNSFVTSGSRDAGWHMINAEALVNCQLSATLGALLQKMPVKLLDLEYLASVQNLVSSCTCSGISPNSTLISDIFQYILFDFRVWCLAIPEVQYSHVQYLSTLIKEDKRTYRTRFGVQYFLDVVKTYYCSTNTDMDAVNARNIRNSLLGLIKFYMIDDIKAEELDALLNFVSLASDTNELQACEVLDLIKSLWYCSCRDQLCTLMVDPKYSKRLYTILALSSTSADQVRVSILEVIVALFKSNVVSERHSHMLRSTSVGFHGIVWLMTDRSNSNKLCTLLLTIVKELEYDGASFMAVLQILNYCDIETRKKTCQDFLMMAYSKSSFLSDCTKQRAWQETMVLLLALETSPNSEDGKSENGSEAISSPASVESLDRLPGEHSINAHYERASSYNFSRSGSFSSNISNNLAQDFYIVRDEDVQVDGTLVELVVEAIFLLMWRGISGSSKEAWKERGQIFTCIDHVKRPLMRDAAHLKVLILEHCVEAAHSDVRDSSVGTGTSQRTSFSTATENSAELVRIVYDFLVNNARSNASLWTEKLLHNLYALYDALVVWVFNEEVSTSALSRATEWKELASIGLRLLVSCIETGKLELLAMASAKLHNLIHSREPASTSEVCYLLSRLHSIVKTSIAEDSNTKDFVVPLIRDLLDKNFERLQMAPYLSELPPTSGSSRFFDDFLNYCVSKEWATFIGNCVAPNSKDYERKSFNEIKESMEKFWGVTHQSFMVSSHFGAREKGDAKLCFQEHFKSDFMERRRTEEDRQNKNVKSLHNQNIAVLRQWRAAKRFFASERSIWRERNTAQTYWKLSNVENFSRMRLKLTQNYNIDHHEDASRLRDNLAPNEIEEKTNTDNTLVPASAVNTSSDVTKEDDGIGDEDWNMLAANAGSATDLQTAKEKSVFSEDCHLVTLMDVVTGKLEITTTHVYFYDKAQTNNNDEAAVEPGLDFKWSLSQLREVHLRRYNLRKSALELFLIDQSNYFINFDSLSQRHHAYKALLSVHPPNMLYLGTRTPQDLLKVSCVTQKWVQREVSNFDYLMQLNTIAGRTYNDLSQYPVFPWVLTDYTSEKLDLNNPEVYRDLSKPMGVLNPKNQKDVQERYEQFEDPLGAIKKFHYGSHYSNAASVLFFLLRLEPFTTLHIQLQTGRFDLADRQFHSIASTFNMLYDNANDVKELIPEFYYMPEFLVNSNGFDLGKLQFSHENVDNVLLPKWAKNSSDFIFQHRKALESDYVSENLHHWIDLIFGYKQRGQAAVDATNVFYYCTYEGAVDLDAITDPIQRKAVEGMINNFGQTPTQLLREAHPRRMTREEAERKATGRIMSTLNVAGDVKLLSVFESPRTLKAYYADVMDRDDPVVYINIPRSQSHSFIQSGMPDVMVTVSEKGVIGTHGWLPWGRSTNLFEKDHAVGNIKLRKMVRGLFSPGLRFSSRVFLVTNDAKYLIVAGYWDNTIRIMTTRGKPITCLERHLDIVTCLSLDYGGTYMMSGSYDTTCIVWKINQNAGLSAGVTAQPVHILYGHEAVVTAVIINTELDVALSSSKDGTCIIHTVRKGNYVRTIRPLATNPSMFTVPSIAMSEEGKIILYARSKKEEGVEEKHFLHLYSINGRHLALDCLETGLGHMTISGQHLVTGDMNGVLVIRELLSFCELARMPLHVPITSIFVSKSKNHLLATLRDGKLVIINVDRPTVKRSGIFNSSS